MKIGHALTIVKNNEGSSVRTVLFFSTGLTIAIEATCAIGSSPFFKATALKLYAPSATCGQMPARLWPLAPQLTDNWFWSLVRGPLCLGHHCIRMVNIFNPSMASIFG